MSILSYTLQNPDSDTLPTYSTLNHPLGADEALESTGKSLADGSLTLRDLWLLEGGTGNAHAALQLKPYPTQPTWRLGLLRTTPDIPDDAATFLFTRVLELSRKGQPIHLVYNDRSARDFGSLPAALGWSGSDNCMISYRTDLSERDDLLPNPAAVACRLEVLLSDDFRRFYEPVRRRSPSDPRTFEQILRVLYEHHQEVNGSLFALEEDSRTVAMGIVSDVQYGPDQWAGGVNILGVALDKRRRGWGRRLHRHLMWEAKKRSPLYIGGTDASNTAMRRLFAVNGCTDEGSHWELEPTHV